ncbi:MAG TPA: hypothetical protein PKA91_21230, partial [Leptospiraceae bacterium]|nr:hypothetical protein [Leptospiraceae bacterium]
MIVEFRKAAFVFIVAGVTTLAALLAERPEVPAEVRSWLPRINDLAPDLPGFPWPGAKNSPSDHRTAPGEATSRDLKTGGETKTGVPQKEKVLLENEKALEGVLRTLG